MTSRAAARYMQQQAGIMANFVEGSPSSILLMQETPMLRAQDGRVVGVFPLDYVVWTERLAKIMQNLTSQADGAATAESGERWFEGVASPETRKGM